MIPDRLAIPVNAALSVPSEPARTPRPAVAAESRKLTTTELRRLDPFHAPSWRWQWANELHTKRKRLRADIDPSVQESVRFIRALGRGKTAAQIRALDRRFGHVHMAYNVHTHGGLLCDELQARLLARESFEAIGSKTGLPAEMVRFYESLFYNVSDATEAHDWLLTEAIGIGRWVKHPPGEGDMWRFLALAGGPFVVDVVIADALGRPTPDIPNRHLLAQRARFLVRDFADSLHHAIPSREIIEDGAALFCHLLTPDGSRGHAMLRHYLNFLRVASGLPPLESAPVPSAPAGKRPARTINEIFSDVLEGNL